MQVNEMTPTMIAVGNDEDFADLQPTIIESEPAREPAIVDREHIPIAREGPTAQEGRELEFEAWATEATLFTGRTVKSPRHVCFLGCPFRRSLNVLRDVRQNVHSDVNYVVDMGTM